MVPRENYRLVNTGMLLCGALLSACTGVVDKPHEPQPPEHSSEPSQVQEKRIPNKGANWQLSEGMLLIHVGKTGRLARLGHNHLVSTSSLAGEAELTNDGTLVGEVRVDVTDLAVDDPQLREAYRLKDGGTKDWSATYRSTPSAKNMADTRANMLGPKVLNAENYPQIRATLRAPNAAAEFDAAAAGSLPAELSLQVCGATALVPINLAWQRETPDQIQWQSEFEITHKALALVPFSALGGALAVAETMTIEVSGTIEYSGTVQTTAISVLKREKD